MIARPGKVFGALLLALGPWPGAIAAFAQTASDQAVDERVESLLQELASQPPRSTNEVAAALVALGPEAAPVLLAQWTGRISAAMPPERRRSEKVGPDEYRQAIVEATGRALAHQSSSTMVSLAGRWIERSPQLVDGFADVCRIAAELKAPWRSEVFFSALEKLPPGPALESNGVKGTFRVALVAVLADAQALAWVPRLFDPNYRSFWQPTLDALAEVASPAAFLVVSRAMGLEPELDRLVLTTLRRAPALRLAGRAEDVQRLVEDGMDAREAEVRRLAVWAAKDCRMRATASRLVDLLQDPDPRTQLLAADALHVLFQRPYPAQPEPWQRWWSEETEWAAGRASELREELGQGADHQVLRQLAELAYHPLHLDDFQSRLISLRDHESLEVRRAAVRLWCECTPQLAKNDWVEALLDPDPVVRELLGQALCRATGRNLPAEHDQWVGAGFGD